MSYSTRRSGGFGGNQQQSNYGNIGQRRPVVTNNFVPGGQKGAGQNQQTQQARQQPPQAQQQEATQVQQGKPPQPQQQQPPQVKAQPKVETPEKANGEPMEDTETPKKPWMKSGNKISRREKIRRRNVRLSKILQPKNAVMIFNELAKNCVYNVEEVPARPNGCQFKATVSYDGINHEGYGMNKMQAKNNAAEAALRHFIKSKKINEMKQEDGPDGQEKMDVSEEDGAEAPLPWQHVASFAIFKLFSSWGEDPNIVRISPSNVSTTEGLKPENKPAKKMPDNPETVNPLMLVNQMLPQASFEEIGKSGNPPNVVFSYRCNVDEQSFVGTGPNKKAAKKMAAFGACSKVLGIQYPTDVYVPSY